ncbi:MAG: hypothetical protein RML12_02525 [Xanthomonadales bacterium]|nr:hypothetical protein [Xanthomonadales bacterium]
MRRNKLSTAIFAGIAGVAGIAATGNAALYINPDGTGQVLIYPYYTVNNNLQTLISIVNTTDRGKAVKVRFLEGYNSKEVLDFNLYLSEFDVWTAAIISASADTSGPGRLISFDRSCTAPAIPSGGVDFRNFVYALTSPDSGPGTLARTREGHIEMIEMGTVNNAPGFPALTWITHVSGTPANCANIRAAWSPGGQWTTNPLLGITAPTGGLFGSAAIVDVANGVMYSYNADAIDAFRATANHTDPGSVFPSLADNDTAPNPRSSIVFYNGVAVTAQWPAGQAIDATSSVFMHSALANEYSLDTVLRADTEWVVTFPTKRFYVDQATLGAAAPIAPFTRRFPAAGFTTPAPGRACVDIGIQIFDREERRPGPGGIDFSPPPPGAVGPQLCWEAQVISFNQADRVSANLRSRLLGSILYTNIQAADFGFENGWVELDFTTVAAHALRPAATPAGLSFRGLPATGFSVSRYVNANAAPGLLANYSGLWKHRGERLIVTP